MNILLINIFIILLHSISIILHSNSIYYHSKASTQINASTSAYSHLAISADIAYDRMVPKFAVSNGLSSDAMIYIVKF